MIRLLIALASFGTLAQLTKEGLKEHMRIYDEHIRK